VALGTQEKKLTAVDRTRRRAKDKHAQRRLASDDPVLRQRNNHAQKHKVLDAVGKMREEAARVVVASQALDGAPHRRQRAEERHDAGFTRSAVLGLLPSVDVDAEEELGVL